ncbi:MAG TPA: ribosome small subunit-dependent GTPase A [Gemmatimonadaceae bacterium]|nr:ribosome small subunit-dependent GTPase A [Gemmatimonadaceae bacterium]
MTTDDATHLASLGWDADWAAAFRAAGEVPGRPSGNVAVPGRVVAEHRERYSVSTADGEVSAVLAGRLRHDLGSREDLPAVGDWVGISRESGEGTAVVRFVVPRRSAFVRKSAGTVTEAQIVAANVDVALIATALPGDLSSRRLERYLTLAWESGTTPVVVLTKSDLSNDVRGAMSQAALAAPGVEIIAVSAVSGEGMDSLSRWLEPGATAVLLGSSGVGKSTLVNRLLGTNQLRTATVRSTGKGRHTTTHRELVRLSNGALLIDTPGMRELQLWSADAGLGPTFADIEVFAARCRFRDCVHGHEPGCAVRDAVASGELASERLEHWHRLRRELAFLARKQDERANAEYRARIRGLMRGVRDHQRRKYGDA